MTNFSFLSSIFFTIFLLEELLGNSFIFAICCSAATLPKFIKSFFFDESIAEISLTSGLIKIEAFSLETFVIFED